jgi:DNA-binding NtrC family response regulator
MRLHDASAISMVFSRAGREVFRVPAPRGRCEVGRGPACDIRIPDDARVISRVHFVIDHAGADWYLRDRSQNGVAVDGVAVGGRTVRLARGSRVDFAGWEVRFEGGSRHDEDSTRPAPTGRTSPWLGRSAAIRRLDDAIDRLARFDIPVLIAGETGSGKELAARELHERSARANGPFVAVNCGAMHEETALSSLFGHEKGSFTGAQQRHQGAFRGAHGGTLFLDEIGELSLELQAALLRAVETRQVLPLGAERPVDVDVRLLAATHRDLAEAVRLRRFREDLLFRLDVGSVRVPPLREREDDVLVLARHFLDEAAPHRPPPLHASAETLLRRHRFPGNVRELRNAILRALVASDGGPLRAEHLGLRPGTGAARAAEGVEQALADCGGNRSEAAARLGIARSTLYQRMRRLGLPER